MRATLYSRLKPEYKKHLKSKSENYPFTYKSRTKSLKNNIFYSDLTLFQITDLTCFIGIHTRSNVEWATGKDLFSTEEDVA